MASVFLAFMLLNKYRKKTMQWFLFGRSKAGASGGTCATMIRSYRPKIEAFHTSVPQWLRVSQGRPVTRDTRRGEEFSERGPIYWAMSNYSFKHLKRCPTHSSRGANIFLRGASPPCAPLGYGPESGQIARCRCDEERGIFV